MKRQPPEPKFTAVCTWCGAKTPRPALAFTQERWMTKHIPICPKAEPRVQED